MRLTVIGGSVLGRDSLGTVERLAPDSPGPVLDATEERTVLLGAARAAELLAQRGHQVTLVTPIGRDTAGTQLRSLLERSRVRIVGIPLQSPTPERLRLLAGDRPLVAIDRTPRTGVAGLGPVPAIAADAVAGCESVVVIGDGDGTNDHPAVREVLRAGVPRRPLVWLADATAEQPPARGAALVVVDERNLAILSPFDPADATNRLAALTARTEALRTRWGAARLLLRLADGRALLTDGAAEPTVFAGSPDGAAPTEVDLLRFAALVAAALGAGEDPTGAIETASADPGPTRIEAPDRPSSSLTTVGLEDALALARSIRARGGTVVATGGCFDLLHAGHLSSLNAARALGDCLIVCVNADSSVRRLKGEDRPVIPEDERAATLHSLRMVDAVVVFDEDTPEGVLQQLRPDIFVKGADHTGQLPETDLLASWGGRTVLVPYRAGHSTSRLVGELRRAH